MTAYREDLQAAQQRIRALETEVAALREQSERSSKDGTSRQGPELVEVEQPSRRVPSYVWIVVPLLLLLFSERVPTVFPASALLVLLIPIVLAVKRRAKIRAADNELLLLVQDEHLTGWIGPGDTAKAHRNERVYRLPRGPGSVSVVLPSVALHGGDVVDLLLRAQASFDLEPYRETGATEAIERGLTLLGFPPDFDALSGPLRDAAELPIRRAAETWNLDEIDGLSNIIASENASLVVPESVVFQPIREHYGFELSNLSVTLAPSHKA